MLQKKLLYADILLIPIEKLSTDAIGLERLYCLFFLSNKFGLITKIVNISNKVTKLIIDQIYLSK